MTEEQGAQQPQAASSQPPVGPTIIVPAMDAKEIEEGKAFAVLSYVLSFVGLPFFLVPLIMRNNEFSLYHAKQCLLLWIAGAVGSAISGMLIAVCIGVILLPVVMIAMLVLAIMGLMNASKGEAQPLPVIGKFAEEWFKGIRKA